MRGLTPSGCLTRKTRKRISLPAAWPKQVLLRFATIPESRGRHTTLQSAPYRRTSIPLNASVTKLVALLSAEPYSYVEISGILNKDVYNETVNVCGTDGSGCLNLSDLKSQLPEAPVCEDIKNKTIFPHADLISDFNQSAIPLVTAAGFAVPGDPGSFSQTCETSRYAGCMTAPCKATDEERPETGLFLAKCTCPTYEGPNQVGNPQYQTYSCTPPRPFVWSSSYIDVPPAPTFFP